MEKSVNNVNPMDSIRVTLINYILASLALYNFLFLMLQHKS